MISQIAKVFSYRNCSMADVKLATSDELKQLRDWLAKIPYVDISLCDDNFLQHYYVHRRGSMQDTKETINNFFKSLHLTGKELTLFDPASKTAEQGPIAAYDYIVPKTTDEGEIVTYHCLKLPVHKDYETIQYLRMKRLSLLKFSNFPPSVNAMIVIWDFENYSLEAMSGWDLSRMKLVLQSALKSCPNRVAKIHCINVSTLAKAVVALYISLIQKKYADRVVIHPDLQSLHKHVPKSLLSSDLGGELGTRKELTAEYRQLELKYRDYMVKWQDSLEKSHGKFDDVIGKVQDTSTFRKLEVD